MPRESRSSCPTFHFECTLINFILYNKGLSPLRNKQGRSNPLLRSTFVSVNRFVPHFGMTLQSSSSCSRPHSPHSPHYISNSHLHLEQPPHYKQNHIQNQRLEQGHSGFPCSLRGYKECVAWESRSDLKHLII